MNSMSIGALFKLFDRDLVQLATQIEAYQNADDLWVVKGEITKVARMP